ncbi:hypothetical protein QVD17_39551 [Tagetes erecta]|uniref:Uncharacterized protein n=1 Tax=Tagetes erecta TaxID=13708 RepID=A0AAD8JR02_TARER|nr:hypothetical protein QVD17_39551 [Tagetes erecta]
MDEASLAMNGETKPPTDNRQVVIDGSLPEKLSQTNYGSTSQHHVQEDGSIAQVRDHEHASIGQDWVQEENDQCQEFGPKGHGHDQEDDSTCQDDGQNHVHLDGFEKQLEKSTSRVGDIDTTAPFESVKAAVSMFSGIVDWKAHKVQIAERRKHVAKELRKAQEEISLFKKMSEDAEESKQHVIKELDNAKRYLEELKLNLESAETEESQAKQDAELTILRLEELEHGVEDESSVAIKAQLEVAQARHHAAVSELKMVELELTNLQKDYMLLISEKDLAIKDALEAESNSEETERNVEDLTMKLITMKESLESAHGEYLEADEHRTEVAMVREQDSLNENEELKQSEEELEKASQQMAETEDLKSKLDTTSDLLQSLKTELESYMEEDRKDIQSAIDLANIDLEEAKQNVEKTMNEVNDMTLYAKSLNSELQQEKATIVAIMQNDWMEEVLKAFLEVDIMKVVSEAKLDLPKQLEIAAEESERAKSRALKAREELKKAKKATKQAKKVEKRIMNKLNSYVREVEAARASERLALGAISAAEEDESARSSESEPEQGITLTLDKYYELSRKAKEAEDGANARVSEAISQIDLAKESELRAVKRLEQVHADIGAKKEELLSAVQKAERAKEGKLMVERELRVWRAERLKAKEDADARRKKKKQSLFPRLFFMFLCRKNGRHSKKNNKHTSSL